MDQSIENQMVMQRHKTALKYYVTLFFFAFATHG